VGNDKEAEGRDDGGTTQRRQAGGVGEPPRAGETTRKTTTRRRGETASRRRGVRLETPRRGHRAEPVGSAPVFAFYFLIISHVCRHKPKEGLSFLGIIHLFYYNLCVMSCKLKL
jgi:hypothetical protein